MGLQNALDFARRVASDPTLAARVAAALKDSANSAADAAFSAIGREEGFDFTPKEAAEARSRILQAAPMSDSDLDNVAGGVGAETLAAAAAPYSSWLTTTATQAGQGAAQAHETVSGAMGGPIVP